MENIKKVLSEIIEQASCEDPKCQFCKSYKTGGCSWGCLNERVRLTSPNYSCEHFDKVYNLSEKTIDTLKDLLKNYERVDEGIKNLSLLLEGKITEEDFNDLVG